MNDDFSSETGRRLSKLGYASRLRFKSGDESTSGQIVPKSYRRRRQEEFYQDSEQAPPSDRLRPEGGPLPGDHAGVPLTTEAATDTSDRPATSRQIVPKSGSRREVSRLNQSKLRMEKTGSNLDAAREKLARQKPYKRPGAVKTVTQTAGFGVWVKVHGKIHEVEHENAGVEAAHRAELVGERAGRAASRFVRRRIRARPAQQVAKWERRSVRAGADHRFRQMAHEHPQRNALSRYLYKKQIQRRYRKKAYQEAKRAAKSAQKTAVTTEKLGAGVVRFVRRHPAGVVIALLCFLLIVLLQSCIGGALSIGGGLGGGVAAGTSYLAGDADIDEAELHYTEMETDLLLEAKNAPATHPSYDEYRYDIGDVSHNPFELMAFLTASYDDFTYTGVESVLQEIFNEQYTLTFTPATETRTRTVTDPETGEDTTETYDWHILNVTLTAKSFSGVIFPRMNADQLKRYNLLMATKGNRQCLSSPFGEINWLPYVTSDYGYRVHPISGEKNYHMGIDIGLPAGTDILAGQAGTVTFAGDSGSYGLVVVLDSGAGLVSKYAHCSGLLVGEGQEVKAGDVIARVGSTGNSTGPHLHLEIIKEGHYLNPLYFAVTNDYGQGPVYGDPGPAMGDGSYEALIAEAELHLGKRYVFGSDGPDTFDCSSFVCHVYTRSGVYNLPRTTAQGIYNQAVPISPSEAKPGDLITFFGTYSTSNTITHIGIYVGDGMMIHCSSSGGVCYQSINTAFWQQHFYSFARLPI